jgi:hypothetical protein
MTGDQPVALLFAEKLDTGDVIVLVNREAYPEPEAWALLIADLVQHVVNAYDPPGVERARLHSRIRAIVVAEWARPTAPVVALSPNKENSS